MIKLGQKVTFDPWHGIHATLGTRGGEKVEGTVILINPGHRYFTVSFKLGDEYFRTSFNFVDLYGKDRIVRIVK